MSNSESDYDPRKDPESPFYDPYSDPNSPDYDPWLDPDYDPISDPNSPFYDPDSPYYDPYNDPSLQPNPNNPGWDEADMPPLVDPATGKEVCFEYDDYGNVIIVNCGNYS